MRRRLVAEVAEHLFPARRSHWGFTANGPRAFLCALVSRYLEVHCPNWLRVLRVLENIILEAVTY